MRAAAEHSANVVGVGPHVEAFAAFDGEVDARQGDAVDAVAVDMHKARFADHFLPLSGKLIEWHAIHLDRRNHGWDLVKIPFELLEGGSDLFF